LGDTKAYPHFQGTRKKINEAKIVYKRAYNIMFNITIMFFQLISFLVEHKEVPIQFCKCADCLLLLRT